MASLTFNKEGGNWVAYFKAEADFALHIERDEAGVMSMEQSTTGGGYAVVEDFPARSRYGRAFDYEFSALVYPKFIRIASTTEPTFAAITTDGEITEIKAQSKEIEVTSNGTMDITPDAGFAYLNSVKVKTNVPTSGEGGGSAPSAVEYLDLRGVDGDTRQFLETVSFLGRKEGYIFPTAFVAGLGSTSGQIKYVAIDFGVMCYNGEFGDGPVTLAECLDILGIASVVAAIPRITKEEFYSLNNTHE